MQQHIDSYDFTGKKAIVRVDFNVPLNDKFEITDDTRIRAAIPTLKKVLAGGGSLIIMSHLGRPKGVDAKFSLKHIVDHVSECLGVPVKFADDCQKADAQVAALKPGEALILENLRFYAEEEGKPRGLAEDATDEEKKAAKAAVKESQKEFVKKLASYADCYINDAFGTAHRAHGSTALIAKYFPDDKMFGYLMEGEIKAIDKILADNRQADLQSLIEQDLATADDIAGIDEVDKLLFLKRDFYKLLRNYVSFTDFYSRREGSEAIFQCGRLFIDQRSLDLCIRVEDMVKQTEMAGLSGMYLIYCQCTSKVKNQTMNIVAVLTDGDVDNMRVGKNAIFYDRSGQDWDAVVTKIVDNPISIRQAFFSPYRKLANFITDKVNKSAAEKEAKSMQNLTAKTDSAMASTQANMAAAQANPDGSAPKPAAGPAPFDIAKFAGIFAAIGMALGMIGSAVMKIIDPWYNVIILLVVLAVCTSGPSVFIAWTKLRKRNLGPILNANGWAINSKVIVNIIFGQTLTSLAKYPKLDLKESNDPFMYKTPWWKKALRWVITAAVVVGAVFAVMVALHLGPYAKYYKLEVVSDQPQVENQSQLISGGGVNLKDMKSYKIMAKTNVVIEKDTFEFIGWSDLTNKSADGSKDSLTYERSIQLLQDSTITARFKIHQFVDPNPPAPEEVAE